MAVFCHASRSHNGGVQPVRVDEATKAPTLLYTIVTDRGVSWEQAQHILDPTSAPVVHPNGVVDVDPPQAPGGPSGQLEPC